MADPGWDLKDVASSPESRCAFCLQPVTDAPRTVCGRCRAIYHPDCWRANDERCAVYGCVPAPEPEPRRLRRPVVVPTPVVSSGFGSSPWRFLVVPLVIIGANAARFASQSSRNAAPSPAFRYEAAQPRLELSEEEKAVREARRLLAVLDGSLIPAAGSAERTDLRRTANSIADRLQNARSRYLFVETESARDRLKFLDDLVERLQKKRVELEGP